jgi:hypothetical protein
MERFELPLSQLTLAQKLDIMELIWEDLSRDEQNVNSPDWHEHVLKDREKAFKEGKISVSGWNEAKKRIKRKVECK